MLEQHLKILNSKMHEEPIANSSTNTESIFL